MVTQGAALNLEPLTFNLDKEFSPLLASLLLHGFLLLILTQFQLHPRNAIPKIQLISLVNLSELSLPPWPTSQKKSLNLKNIPASSSKPIDSSTQKKEAASSLSDFRSSNEIISALLQEETAAPVTKEAKEPPNIQPPLSQEILDVLSSLEEITPPPSSQEFSQDALDILSALEEEEEKEKPRKIKEPLLKIEVPTLMTPLEREQYAQQLRSFFVNHWSIPPHLRHMSLQARVRFKVKADGKIIHSQIERFSGNEAFDHAVKTLLKRLQSFPALPNSTAIEEYEFGINFSSLQ